MVIFSGYLLSTAWHLAHKIWASENVRFARHWVIGTAHTIIAFISNNIASKKSS